MVVITERTKLRKTIAVSVLDRTERTETKLWRQHFNVGSVVHKDCWKG